MRYAYHFELCERPGMPAWLRGFLFLTLGWIQQSFGLRRILEKEVPAALAKTRAPRLVEIGSGSGDALARLAWRTPETVRLLATDKFPQVALWRSRLGGHRHVSWRGEAVSFENYAAVLGSDELDGSVILLANTFHHISPGEARSFFARAAEAGAHVLILEPLDRSWKSALLGAATFLPALAAPVLIQGLPLLERLKLALLTWALPLVPLCIAHDGVVSAFRQRTEEDWEELCRHLPYTRLQWRGLGFFENFSLQLFELRGKDQGVPAV